MTSANRGDTDESAASQFAVIEISEVEYLEF